VFRRGLFRSVIMYENASNRYAKRPRNPADVFRDYYSISSSDVSANSSYLHGHDISGGRSMFISRRFLPPKWT
jgi:hypothetical protein